MIGPPELPMSSDRRVDFGEGIRMRVRRFDPVRAVHPPVVLIHGFMGSVESWGDLPERLARDRIVLVPDLPGHGASESPPDDEGWAVPRVAAALGDMVRSLVDGAVDWVGYSMGGRLLLAGLAEGSCTARRVVLESTSPGLRTAAERARRRRVDAERAEALEQGGIDPFVDAWLSLPLFRTQRRLPSEVRAMERARRRRHDPSALARCLRGGGTGRQPSYWGALGEIRNPALILTGALDEKFVTIGDAMARTMPRARRETVAGSGHTVHLERPEAWLAAVRRSFAGAGC